MRDLMAHDALLLMLLLGMPLYPAGCHNLSPLHYVLYLGIIVRVIVHGTAAGSSADAGPVELELKELELFARVLGDGEVADELGNVRALVPNLIEQSVAVESSRSGQFL